MPNSRSNDGFCQWQADNAGVTALNVTDEHGCHALNTVGTCLVHWFTGNDVVVDFAGQQRAKPCWWCSARDSARPAEPPPRSVPDVRVRKAAAGYVAHDRRFRLANDFAIQHHTVVSAASKGRAGSPNCCTCRQPVCALAYASPLGVGQRRPHRATVSRRYRCAATRSEQRAQLIQQFASARAGPKPDTRVCSLKVIHGDRDDC